MKVLLCLFAIVSLFLHMTLGDDMVKEICRQGGGSSKCKRSNTYTWNSRMKKCRAVRVQSGPCGFFNILDRCNEICAHQEMTDAELEVFIQKYAT